MAYSDELAKISRIPIAFVKMTMDYCNKGFSDENLVGFWPLDEISGSIAPDESGNENDGTLVNMEDADWVDGVVGKCLDFDGVNELVNCGNAGLDLSGDGTISLWIKRSAVYADLAMLVDRYAYGYAMFFDSATTIAIRFGATRVDGISVGDLFDGDWHHIVMVRDSGTSLKLYVDTIEKFSGADDGNDASSAGSTLLGSRGVTHYNYDGLIDEVRIYNTALTASEIKALYNNPSWPRKYCTATASVKCYNTYPTCRDKANFDRTTKEYKFTSADAPLPFKTGERPYIKKIKYMPTEIKDSLTVSARIVIELYDEPDTDVGIDPYLSDRSSVQGTFWKKFLARNTNYKGRKVQMYDGFIDLAEGDFEEKFVGEIDNVKITKDVVKIEVVDLLKSLAKIEIPPKLNIKLANDSTDSQVQMTLEGEDVSSLDDPAGYVRIDDEIIYYAAINTITKIISSCTRGHFSTTAASHSARDKVQKTRYFAPASGFDHMKNILLTDCGIAAGYVNSTEFDAQRDDDAGDPEVDFSAIISEPVKAEKLYFELVDLLNCKSWVAEDLKITIKRNLPNRPGRSYTTITDTSNIIFNSPKVDLNQKSRISRVSLYWDRTAIGDNNEPADFARLDVAVDSDAESVNEYNEIAEKEIFCRWLRSGYDTEENMANFAKNHTSRLVGQFRDPMAIIELSLELKDSGIKTGDYVKISTDELQDKNGDDLALAPFQVIRREKKGHQIKLKCLRITPKKYLIIAPAGYSGKDYDSATAAEREYGAISDINGLMVNGDDGYKIF